MNPEEIPFDDFEDFYYGHILPTIAGQLTEGSREEEIVSNQAEGFIEKIAVKDGQGSRGPWALDNLLLVDRQGNEMGWYGLGFRENASIPPKCQVGDYVSFSWTPNGQYKDIVKGSARIVGNAPERTAPAKPASAPAGAKSAGTTQQNIHYQNSRTAAIETLGVLLANNSIAMPATNNKAGKAKAYEACMAVIDKLTVRYFNDLESFRLLETVADEGEIDTSGDGALPDTEADPEVEDNGDEPI